jgi:hypothetical protein
LAKKYYKDSDLWWLIARANNLPGDSIFVEPAQRIIIPFNYLKIISSMES